MEKNHIGLISLEQTHINEETNLATDHKIAQMHSKLYKQVSASAYAQMQHIDRL